MIACRVINLLIPGDPVAATLQTPFGPWTLDQDAQFAINKAGILAGKVGETYWLENPVNPGPSLQIVDNTFDEVTPILLGCAYAIGLAVTCHRTSSTSMPMLMQPSQHWPRERAMGAPNYVVVNQTEFEDIVGRFVAAWLHSGAQHKAMLLINHWLDALSCWSMEDLYLSATTLLQIVAATEARQRGVKGKYQLYDMVTKAAGRMGLAPPNHDVIKMRNDLVHEGNLVAKKFRGTTRTDCATAIGEVLHWFDEYLHTALALGPIRRRRFTTPLFINVNSYSF